MSDDKPISDAERPILAAILQMQAAEMESGERLENLPDKPTKADKLFAWSQLKILFEVCDVLPEATNGMHETLRLVQRCLEVDHQDRDPLVTQKEIRKWPDLDKVLLYEAKRVLTGEAAWPENYEPDNPTKIADALFPEDRDQRPEGIEGQSISRGQTDRAKLIKGWQDHPNFRALVHNAIYRYLEIDRDLVLQFLKKLD